MNDIDKIAAEAARAIADTLKLKNNQVAGLRLVIKSVLFHRLNPAAADAGQQIVQIPVANGYQADRYDTGNEHVITLWREGDTFDIRIQKVAASKPKPAEDEAEPNFEAIFAEARKHPAYWEELRELEAYDRGYEQGKLEADISKAAYYRGYCIGWEAREHGIKHEFH